MEMFPLLKFLSDGDPITQMLEVNTGISLMAFVISLYLAVLAYQRFRERDESDKKREQDREDAVLFVLFATLVFIFGFFQAAIISLAALTVWFLYTKAKQTYSPK